MRANQYYYSHYPIIGDYSHGSLENARNHKQMMEQIANDIVRQAIDDYDSAYTERIEEIMAQAYKQAIDDFMEAITYDIESVVTVGLNGCEEIFRDKKTQQIISDRIIQEVRKKLNQKHLLF